MSTLIGGAIACGIALLLLAILKDMFTPKKKPQTTEQKMIESFRKWAAEEHEKNNKKLGGK